MALAEYIMRNAFSKQKITYIEDTGKVLYRSAMTHGNNNVVLTDISQKLARVGIDPAGSVYIADSAFVTEDNLRLTGNRTLFISRLPATFGEHQRLIQEAVQSQSWSDYGMLAITAPTTAVTKPR
jgi:hypothetical protein